VVGVEELVVDAEAEFEGDGEEGGRGWFLLLRSASHGLHSWLLFPALDIF